MLYVACVNDEMPWCCNSGAKAIRDAPYFQLGYFWVGHTVYIFCSILFLFEPNKRDEVMLPRPTDPIRLLAPSSRRCAVNHITPEASKREYPSPAPAPHLHRMKSLPCGASEDLQRRRSVRYACRRCSSRARSTINRRPIARASGRNEKTRRDSKS